MANNYIFEEATTADEKIREAIQQGTDGSGRPILRNVVAVEPGSNPLNVSIGSQSADLASETTLSGVESAIGDQSTASQNADSSTSATLIERVTALVDALTSGQADDELRVALAADVLSGALSVSVDGQTGTLDIDLSSESLTSNLDVDIAAQTSGALTVTDDGALNINSLPSLPTGTNNIGAVDLGSLNGAATESTLSTVAAKLTNAEDGDGNAFDVNITEESVDVATQTTLSSVLTKLTNAEDSDGNAFDANMVSRVLTSAPSYSDGAWENPWLDSKGRLQVMDQNLILVGDGNSIESVLSTDHVVAEGNVKSPLSVHDTQNGTGTTTLVASSTGEKVRVMRLKVQHKDSSNSGTAVMLTIQDASTGTVLEEIPCSSYSDGTVLQAPTSGLLFETGAGNALEMTADGSVAVTVSATFVYA